MVLNLVSDRVFVLRLRREAIPQLDPYAQALHFAQGGERGVLIADALGEVRGSARGTGSLAVNISTRLPVPNDDEIVRPLLFIH
jgi:hypothetical protein